MGTGASNTGDSAEDATIERTQTKIRALGQMNLYGRKRMERRKNIREFISERKKEKETTWNMVQNETSEQNVRRKSCSLDGEEEVLKVYLTKIQKLSFLPMKSMYQLRMTSIFSGSIHHEINDFDVK